MNANHDLRADRDPRPTLAWLAALLLIFALWACAPTVRGSLPDRPVDVDLLDLTTVIEVVPGRTLYVTNSSFYADPQFFGYSREDVNDLLALRGEEVGDSVSRDVSDAFDLLEVQAPDGWNVALYRVRATREIVDEDREHRIWYFQDNIELYLAIDVTEGAPPGSRGSLQLTIGGKGDTVDRIVLRVRILDPEV